MAKGLTPEMGLICKERREEGRWVGGWMGGWCGFGMCPFVFKSTAGCSNRIHAGDGLNLEKKGR